MHHFVDGCTESMGEWRGAEGRGMKQVSMGGHHKGWAACTYHVGGGSWSSSVGGWWGMKRGGASVGVELASEKRVP